MKPVSIKKPLLISATAFLTFSPLCFAQMALASTSTSAFERPISQHQKQTTSEMRLHTQLQTSLNRLLRSSNPLSVSVSLDALKSTLSTYKEQLRLLSLKVSNQERLQPLESAISALEQQIQAITAKQSALQTAQATLTRTTAAYAKALETLNEATANKAKLETTNEEASTAYTQALTALNEAKTALTNAQAAATQAANNLTQATTNLNEASSTLTSKLTALQNAQNSSATATEALQNAQSDYEKELENFLTKTGNKSAALLTFNEAVQKLEAAQDNYNTNLIPDPTYIPPTYQKENVRYIPYTEIQEVRTLVPTTTMIAIGGVKAEVFNRQGYNNAPPLPTENEVPIHTTTVSTINFNWGGGNVLGSNRSEDVIVRFSGNLLVPVDGYYQFYSPADDGTKLDIAGMSVISDWYDKGGGGTISEPVYIRAGIFYPFTLHYYENGGGAAVSFYTYSPQQGFSIVPNTWMGSSAEQQTTYEEVITYEEVTKYREEIYYTTEPVLVEGSLQVKINEGGQATFTAPEGATFTTSSLRYEATQRPDCGIDINPPVQGQTQITIQASNSVYGDPCGGWYKHVTGTISYFGQPTAPLINDPALLPAVEQALEAKQSAEAALQEATQEEALSSAALNEASLKVSAQEAAATISERAASKAQSDYDSALVARDQALEAFNIAQSENQTATTNQQVATEKEAAETSKLLTATSNLSAASANLAVATTQLATATKELTTTETNLTTATDVATSTTTDLTNTVSDTEAVSASIPALFSNTLPDPEPEPEPEPTGSAEIPAVIENIMDVDLTAVDPTELTEAQAEQLVEAALETFETATEGSPEYEQALDALFLAAQQDDIVVDESLAAIPGVGEAAKAVVAIFNLVGNVGADIAPEKRKEAQTLVVTTLVVGQIAQTAALASASSGGSFRRK